MSQKNILIIVAVIIVLGLLFLGFKSMSTDTVVPTDEEVASTSVSIMGGETPTSGNDCEAACANYANKCLSLVPNADQNLINQGLVSCMQECQAWPADKTGCMVQAIDCPAMTESCGL
jgi:coenzyme F420-reducing hydrogenase gamma subunit